MAALSVHADIKLNMALHIEARREDGYHLLDTLVVFAKAQGDNITYQHSDEPFQLRVSGAFAYACGDIEHNLVWRAVRAMCDVLRLPFVGQMELEKTVPVGAGLGGGSADAVAACRLYARAHAVLLAEAQLAELLLPLGADMPMCVAGRPLVARGIGEKLSPVPFIPRCYAVLCCPDIQLPTKAVYAAYRHEARRFPDLMALPLNASSWWEAMEHTRNVLQRPAISCAAEVAEVLLALETHPIRGFVRMSGSGACCVSYLSDAQSAETLAASLLNDYPRWWVHTVRL